jgi:hypothetical protein
MTGPCTTDPGMFVDVTLRRPDSSGGYVNGNYVPAATTDTTIKGSIQPASGRELLDFPEAQRVKISRKIYTVVELRIGDDDTQNDSDRIIYDNEIFKVVKVEKFAAPGLDLENWKSFLIRE